jgi:hypothetical protein
VQDLTPITYHFPYASLDSDRFVGVQDLTQRRAERRVAEKMTIR